VYIHLTPTRNSLTTAVTIPGQNDGVVGQDGQGLNLIDIAMLPLTPIVGNGTAPLQVRPSLRPSRPHKPPTAACNHHSAHPHPSSTRTALTHTFPLLGCCSRKR